MSLIHCPECKNEISNEAGTCPNCGRPLSSPTPVIQRNDVVNVQPREESFPKWIIVPVVILCLVGVFFLLLLMRSSDENANTQSKDINVATRRNTPDPRETTQTQNPPNQIEAPSNSTIIEPPSSQPDVSTVPPKNGLVEIEAKILTKNGTIQAVINEKFYLLDNDLESILNDANLTPINGQTLTNSFGLAVLNPDKYPDFHRDSLNAIKKHIKYDTLSDDSGKASMKEVKPDNYYLFAITKTRTGFAIWNTPLNIVEGENKLNLSPPKLTEISE